MADILVAEDTELQSSLIQSFLSSEHTIVGTPHDGMETIAMAKVHDPDVIIMDINMPKIDGIQATKEVKEIDPDITVIVSTVMSDDVTADIRAAGADDVLKKPYSRERLLAAIDAALG